MLGSIPPAAPASPNPARSSSRGSDPAAASLFDLTALDRLAPLTRGLLTRGLLAVGLLAVGLPALASAQSREARGEASVEAASSPTSSEVGTSEVDANAEATSRLAEPGAVAASRLAEPDAEAALHVPSVALQPAATTPDQNREARLNLWLDEQFQTELALTAVTGVTGLALGSVILGTGLFIAFDRDFNDGRRDSEDAAVAMVFTAASALLGGLLIATGAYALTTGTSGTDRYARWRDARAGGLSPNELARFEGELRAEARQETMQRGAAVAMGTAFAGAGALVLAASLAVPNLSDDERIIGGTVGGASVALGTLAALVTLIEGPRAAAWRHYQAGHAPGESAGLQLQVSPMGVSGAF